MTSQQTQFFEDDFKELDRILQIAKTPQDWDNADMLYMYLTGKIDRLSFSATPYKINTYEQSVLNKYKIKQQQKEQEKQRQKRERIAEISPIFEILFVILFIAFQIWLNFQYTKTIEATLLVVGAWVFSFYVIKLVDFLPVGKVIKNGIIRGFLALLILFGTPALNTFLSYKYINHIGITILHYCMWLSAFLNFVSFTINRDKEEENYTKILLFLVPITLALCLWAYYLRPV